MEQSGFFKHPDVGPARVLIAEDDPETRAIMSFTLQASGHEIIEVSDGAAAIEEIRLRLPDVVVSDIMMPEVTGIDLVQWIRENISESYIPVLFVSALSEIEDRVEGLRVGADDYLPKPFHSRELQARVNSLLRIKSLTEKLLARTHELRNANAELLRTQEALLQAERELVAAQVAGAAAHNLGQPVTTILFQCGILEKLLGKETPQGPGGVTGALESIRRETLFIQDILASLKNVDPAQTESYVGDVRITRLQSETRKGE